MKRNNKNNKKSSNKFINFSKNQSSRLVKGINRYWEAIMVEIRGGITKTPLHMLKTVVIFFIPFLYAFTYLWAFYDPISKTDNLNISIITDKNDALGEFVKQETDNKGITIHNGPNVSMNANLNHIYSDTIDTPIDENNQIVKDSLLTINVPGLDKVVVETLRDAITAYSQIPSKTEDYFTTIAKTLRTFLAANMLNGKPSTQYNYKKNFLIGFATDISSAQSGGLNAVLEMLIKALQVTGANPLEGNVITKMITGQADANGVITGQWTNANGEVVDRTFSHHQWASSGGDPAHPAVDATKCAQFMQAVAKHMAAVQKIVGTDKNGNFGGFIKNAAGTSTETVGVAANAIPVITLHSQMGTDGHEDFGVGLSPFFISIGMWFGAVGMTVLIHRKIYNKKTYVKWRYMAKGTLINAGVVIQATVLMLALKFIGLDTLGFEHWAIMYGTAIFAGIIFATFIMAIRLAIPSRSMSIYIIVIFMVLNIVCSGGLFPIQTQNGFVRAMNTWLPMNFSVEMLRQGLTATDWGIWGANFGYLSIFLLFVPLGVALNFKYTHRWYIRHEYEMPKHMEEFHLRWLARRPKRRKAIIKRLIKSERATKRGGVL